ncbi:MAG: metalloregulator ArsR/SmtB family transcription factor [Anaerolineales bacterium]|nr:MAG: metalloregulator ArsR/SmtB family transcription factor [Anaerolineales bacterium]
MPLQDFIEMPSAAAVSVALEPAQNAVHSLVLLAKAEDVSGLSDWVTGTAHALTPSERRQHKLVTIGFHYAIVPEQSWSSFPAYVDHLATGNPQALRDKMLAAYAKIPSLADCEKQVWYDEPAPIDLEAILKDVDSYLDFLRERFDAEHLDVELEAQAYSYVVDPPAMQELIVSHLRKMWDEYLASEWERVAPMLQDAVKAFQQIDLSNMSKFEAAQLIAGQELEREKWERKLERAEKVVFVPSAHVGPYLGKLWAGGDTFWMLFGARLPEGVAFDAPDLSRAEIVVRLSALADDNRLRILKLISENGELSSQDIMASLGLSQSAASRHLKQLSASGYLSERRCNVAKCYQLNPERIEKTLQAVSNFLLGK